MPKSGGSNHRLQPPPKSRNSTGNRPTIAPSGANGYPWGWHPQPAPQDPDDGSGLPPADASLVGAATIDSSLRIFVLPHFGQSGCELA
jgi:hypothetical protein